jgi:integrase
MYADEQNQKTKKRLRNDYNRFLELNSQEDKDDIPFLLMAQMKRHGLSAGSTSTYLQGLLGKRSSAAKAAGKRHADKPSGHAEDADMSRFGVYDPQLWMMAATGMHAKDAQKLRVLQMSLRKRHLRIQWRWTKGKSKRQHRDTVKYAIKHLPKPPKELKRILKHQTSQKRPLKMNAKEVNALLDRLRATRKRVKHMPRVTSMSFRRYFAQTMENLGYNEQKISRMMGHRDATMQRAHYKSKWCKTSLPRPTKKLRTQHRVRKSSCVLNAPINLPW